MNEQEISSDQFESVDAILAELRKGDEALPVAALRAAQANREQVIPRLIQVLEEALLPNKADDLAVFYALFLLTEFEAKEAFGALVKVLHLEEDVLDALFGDALTETLPVALCVLGEDQPDVVESLIANPEVWLYVRWSAAIALVTMVKKGRQTREDVLRRLHRQLKLAIEKADLEQADLLVYEMHRLAPAEYMNDIRTVFKGRSVAECLISLKKVEESVALGKAAVEANLSHLETSIEDTVAELESWAASKIGDGFLEEDFDDDFDDDFENDSDPNFADEFEDEDYSLDDMPEPRPGTVVHREERVGRNDPCPCGSGKKFKKCCGAPGKRQATDD